MGTPHSIPQAAVIPLLENQLAAELQKFDRRDFDRLPAKSNKHVHVRSDENQAK